MLNIGVCFGALLRSYRFFFFDFFFQPLSLLQSVLASHPYHSSYTHSLPDLSTTPATTEGLMSFSVPAPNTGSHWEGPLPLVGSGTLSTGMCRLHPVYVLGLSKAVVPISQKGKV